MSVSTKSKPGPAKIARSSPRPPKYLQLAEQIRAQVEAGVRLPGEQLPSFAQMQAEHNLSQSTLEKMYRVLEQQKLIVREPGRGIYIAQAKTTRTGVIGLIVQNMPERHPYFTHLLAGIRDAARNVGVEIMLINDGKAASWEKMDGVVFCYPYSSDLVHLLPPGIPRVSVLHPTTDTPTVATDDYHGMTEAVEYLLEQGHRRIACITVAASGGADFASKQRLVAYNDVMRQHGIDVEPGWIQPLRDPYDTLRPFMEAGHSKMSRWIKEGWKESGCTAILLQNDDAAIGAIEALQEAGYDVPGDISVVGFDGTENGDYFRPRLTTVQVPLYEIGKAGTEMLIGQITGAIAIEPSETTTQFLPSRLKIGNSTRALPAD